MHLKSLGGITFAENAHIRLQSRGRHSCGEAPVVDDRHAREVLRQRASRLAAIAADLHGVSARPAEEGGDLRGGVRFFGGCAGDFQKRIGGAPAPVL